MCDEGGSCDRSYGGGEGWESCDRSCDGGQESRDGPCDGGGECWGGEESCDGPCNGEEHIDRSCAGQGEEGHVISYEESQQVM